MILEKYTSCRIFVIGLLASSKTGMLAEENEAAFKRHFLPELAENAKKLPVLTKEQLPDGCELFETDRGFYDTLWDMAEEKGCGLEIDIRKVPVAQETVEIFEYFDMDPYAEPSPGTFIALTELPGRLEKELEDKGIAYEMIGYVTKGPARIVKNAGRIRYLGRSLNDKEVTEAEKES